MAIRKVLQSKSVLSSTNLTTVTLFIFMCIDMFMYIHIYIYTYESGYLRWVGQVRLGLLTDSCHLLAGEVLSAPLLGDVVVQVPAVGLNRGHVQLHQVSWNTILLITIFKKQQHEILDLGLFSFFHFFWLAVTQPNMDVKFLKRNTHCFNYINSIRKVLSWETPHFLTWTSQYSRKSSSRFFWFHCLYKRENWRFKVYKLTQQCQL